MNDVVFLDNDCEKGAGVELAKKYEVSVYPTFIMVNAEGVILERWAGYPGAEAWAKLVNVGVGDQRSIAVKKEAFDAKPTLTLGLSVANDAFAGSDYRRAVDYTRMVRKLDPDNAISHSSDILQYMYYGSRSDVFKIEEVAFEARQVMNSDTATIKQKIDVAGLVTDLARDSGDPDKATPYLEQALAASADSQDEAVIESRKSLLIDHALLVEKDADKAVRLRKHELPEGWQEDPRQLGRFAWWCFENDVNLAEAEDLALKGVELAEDDGMRANILDTAAEICNARGNCDKAIARIKQAIALSPDREYFKNQLARFEQEKQEKEKG